MCFMRSFLLPLTNNLADWVGKLCHSSVMPEDNDTPISADYETKAIAYGAVAQRGKINTKLHWKMILQEL